MAIRGKKPVQQEDISLPYKFEPREYQYPMLRYFDETPTRQRAFVLAHRRAGKDLLAWNILIKESQKRVGTYWHVLPLLNQARKILWTGSTKDGTPFLGYIPPPLIQSKRDDDMSIRLKNGSLIQLVGADRIDSLMGSNPIGVVLSEYALMKPSVWDYISPILNENDGWAMFITTPRGRNHAFTLFKSMVDTNIQKNAGYFVQVLTVDDTRKRLVDRNNQEIIGKDGKPIMIPVLSQEYIEQQRDQNVAEEIIQQEYYCSFEAGLHGSYYAEAMKKLEDEGRALYNPQLFDPEKTVYTAWDIGLADAMSIWYFQVIGSAINIIEYNEFVGKSIIECCHIVLGDWELLRQECKWSDEEVQKAAAQYSRHKKYNYNKHHFGPHDLNQRDIATKVTRKQVAKQHGIDFKCVPKADIQSGIDLVRRVLNNVSFDLTNALQGVRGLKEYRKKWNEAMQRFDDAPVHDWSSHPADGFRYLCQAVVAFIDKRLDQRRPALADGLSDYNPIEDRARYFDELEEQAPVKGKLTRWRNTQYQFAETEYDRFSI